VQSGARPDRHQSRHQLGLWAFSRELTRGAVLSLLDGYQEMTGAILNGQLRVTGNAFDLRAPFTV